MNEIQLIEPDTSGLVSITSMPRINQEQWYLQYLEGGANAGFGSFSERCAFLLGVEGDIDSRIP